MTFNSTPGLETTIRVYVSFGHLVNNKPMSGSINGPGVNRSYSTASGWGGQFHEDFTFTPTSTSSTYSINFNIGGGSNQTGHDITVSLSGFRQRDTSIVCGGTDSDDDGVPDWIDKDSDNDGILDVIEGNVDTDEDGTPDYLDLDSDGDGLYDVLEGSLDNSLDADLDGIVDGDVNNDGVPIRANGGNGVSPNDSDSDGYSNQIDLDSDNDAILDNREGSEDIDNDNQMNFVDLDSDGDGCSDAYEANATQDQNVNQFSGTDSNQNGLIDQFEINDTGEINYASTAYKSYDGNHNACQANDFDMDGISDDVDLDDDNDGVLDTTELSCGAAFATIDSVNRTAGQQLIEATFTNGQASTTVDVALDQTNSALSNSYITGNASGLHYTFSHNQKEVTTSYTLNGNNASRLGSVLWGPTVANTTNSTTDNDAQEIILFWADSGFEALINDPDNQLTQNDGSLIQSGASINQRSQLDNSTATWSIEFKTEANTNYFQLKATHIANDTALGYEGYGIKPALCYLYDTDNDNQPNHLDLDSDGDGCSDANESGATNDISTDFQFSQPDTNQNGLMDIIEGNEGEINYASTYYFANSVTLNKCRDTDNDGIGDLTDIDDDNDGILDKMELNCQPSSAETSTYDLSNKLIEGNFSTSEASVFYRVDMADASANLTAANNLASPDGLHYIYSDNSSTTSMQTTITLTPQSNALLSEVIWGPNIIYNTVDNDNNAQTISLSWEPNVNAIVHDPDNQLDVADGSVINSGTVLLQNSNQNNKAATWYIMFDNNFLPGDFVLDIEQDALTGSLSLEGFGLKTSICNATDTDGDGEINSLDPDSDGDQCPDATEVGNATSSDPNFMWNTTDANQNGLVDQLELNGANGNGELNYNPPYDIALDANLNNCADSDQDGIGDLTDIDDDNDGVLDSSELNCGNATAQNSLYQRTVGSQKIEGQFTKGDAMANYSIDLSQASVALTAANEYDGSNGLHYIFNDGQTTTPISSSIVITPSSDTFINGITFGPTVTGNTDTENDTEQQLIILKWTPNITATIHDPDNQLENEDGSLLTSGENIIQLADEYNSTANWFVTFDATLNAQEFTLNIIQKAYQNTLATEGFGIKVDLCHQSDNDGDGILNHLDTDSDGDGCFDAFESGALDNNTSQLTGVDSNGNGLIDSVESSNMDGAINYTASYYVASSVVLNGCNDTDNDGIADLVDIDDDNDGIPDEIELGCENGIATNTIYERTAGSQRIEGTLLSSAEEVGYSIDLSDASSALSTSYNFSGNQGLHYIFYDNSSTAPMVINSRLTPQTGALMGNVVFGPNVSLVHNVNDTEQQSILMEWSPAVPAKIIDPDNQLDLADGTIISSGQEITQLVDRYNGIASWSIEFDTAFLTGDFELTTSHDALTGSLAYEGFGMTVNICSGIDTDGDGQINHVDLDSDNDGCSDAYESGYGTDPDFEQFTSEVGDNGLADNLETSTDSGELNQTLSYDLATNENLNLCLDTDGDGIGDIVDIDDDNDGITDLLENLSCGAISFNKSDIIVSSDLTHTHATTWDTRVLDDNLTTNAFYFNPDGQDITNQSILSFEFSDLMVINQMEITQNPNGFLEPTAIVKIQGSIDGVNWEDLSSNINYANAVGALTNAAAAVNYEFNVDGNSYRHYRIFGVSGNSNNQYLREANFNVTNSLFCDSDGDGISNHLDLDSDNDGIYDSVEAGHDLAIDQAGRIDTAINNSGDNGLFNSLENNDSATAELNYTLLNSDNADSLDYLDLDSDNDNCVDAVEAGFQDPDTDGELGSAPVTVDDNGVITGQNGYDTPRDGDNNATYDYRELSTYTVPSQISNPEDVDACIGTSTSFNISTDANAYIQWQRSTDGQNWEFIDDSTDQAAYTGFNTETLEVNVASNMDQYAYRAVASAAQYLCDQIFSEAAVLNLSTGTDQIDPGTPIYCASEDQTVADLINDLNQLNTGLIDLAIYSDELGNNSLPEESILNTGSYYAKANCTAVVEVEVVVIDNRDEVATFDYPVDAFFFCENNVTVTDLINKAIVDLGNTVNIYVNGESSPSAGNRVLNEYDDVLAKLVHVENGVACETVTTVQQITGTITRDQDADGICDSYEFAFGDSDQDGFDDLFDIDSDNDGISDQIEAATDPLAPSANPRNNDHDQYPNHLDLDSDDDGIADIIEADQNDRDTDNNGQIDEDDQHYVDDNDNGMHDDIETKQPTNTDIDEFEDYIDVDTDNDGVPDSIEHSLAFYDLNIDGRFDQNDADWSDVNENGQGDLTEGVMPIDVDSDGLPDFRDLDSDNDTASDLLEVGLSVYDTNGDQKIDRLDNGFADVNRNGWADDVQLLFSGSLDEATTIASQTINFITEADIELYPNPVVRRVNLNGLEGSYKFRVYNHLGQIVKRGKRKAGKNRIGMKKLPTGQYILKILQDGKTYSKHFIKK